MKQFSQRFHVKRHYVTLFLVLPKPRNLFPALGMLGYSSNARISGSKLHDNTRHALRYARIWTAIIETEAIRNQE